MAYAMSHKGKATAPETSYNPDDPPEAYSNSSVHTRLTDYIEAARAVHGADFDPASEDLDGSIVMRVGGGKKHVRYWLGDGVIDSSSTPTLAQLRALTTSGSVPIRPRPSPSQSRVAELEVIFVLLVVH
jgi:sugar phosphate isomerase/epimerase